MSRRDVALPEVPGAQPEGAHTLVGLKEKSEDQPQAKQIARQRAFGTLHDTLPLPAYRGDRLAFAPHTAGLWPDCSMSA